MLNWFVGKELRHKVELTIGEAQPIQNHRHHGCSYAHTSATFARLPVKPCGYSGFSTDSGYYSQMIQSFRLVIHFL
jgi:hypothetical protein